MPALISISTRRTLTLTLWAIAIATAVLLVLGTECAIYLALSGEPASLSAVWREALRGICGWVPACSA